MSVIERWIVHYAGGAHIFDNEDDARHAAAPAMLRVEGPFVLDLDQRLQGAVEAIAAHRAEIESIGMVEVADDESRRRAEAKHAADLALWQQGGGR